MANKLVLLVKMYIPISKYKNKLFKSIYKYIIFIFIEIV